MSDEELQPITIDADIQVRNLEKREIDVRLVPWGKTINTGSGTEEFQRGAFDGIDESKVLLQGLEHEVHFGLSGGQVVPTRHPVGKGVPGSYQDLDDGAHLTVRVAKTARGDEVLTLADEQIVTGVSAEFMAVPGGTTVTTRSGRRHSIHTRAALAGLSMTYRPAYGEQAAVLAVRSRPEGDGRMAETEAAVAAPEPAVPAIVPTIDTSAIQRAFDSFADRMNERVERIEERSRQEIVVPTPQQMGPKLHKGHWAQIALKILTGERVPELQTRVLADLVTTDNAGVVPEAYSTELIGIIDPRRPFLGSTNRIPTPDSGMTLNLPKLVTRPTAGVQVNEKDDITSTVTSITNVGFDAITIAGGGDISLQLLKRSSPSYLDLYLRLLAEALAKNAEAEAIDALLAAGVTPGTGTLDPEALTIGEAWENGQAVGVPPDHIWLSSAGVSAFLDAKNSGANAPLYGNLAGRFSVAGGAGGDISGLIPVYVPALDATATDVIIGPSQGFAWAEDGAFTLQVDVPAKAGRDVALVVIDWFAPLYPAAFTTYAV